MKKSKKRLIIRLLFVLFCAVALTGASVLLGAHLKEKAESVVRPSETVTETESKPQDTDVLYPDGIPSSSDASLLTVCAADIDITVGSAQSVYDRITALSDTYNAVSVRLVSDGRLVYVSPALLEYVGVSPDDIPNKAPSPSVTEALPAGSADAGETEVSVQDAPAEPAEDPYALLTAAAAGAKNAGMRLSAVYTTSPDVLSGDDEAISNLQKEKIIIAELVSLGFDEIIIDGLAGEDEDLSYDKVRSIITYLAKLRGASGEIDIGITLPASVYLISQMASKIKTLSEYADFLAIGISTDANDPDEAYSLVYESCYSLKGNFSVYNIRGVIVEDDPSVAAAICASLRDMSVESVQFTVYNAAPDFEPHVYIGDSPAETETYTANDNALRAEDYAVSATASAADASVDG